MTVRLFKFSMEWKTDCIFEFLKLYQAEPTLWNTLSMEHKNKDDTHDAWNRIKEKLGDGNVSIREIKRKRDNLMSTYRRLRGKVEKSKLEGEVFTPDWPFYNVMSSFLDDMYNPRKLPDCSTSVKIEPCSEGNDEDSGNKDTAQTPKRRKTQNLKNTNKTRHEEEKLKEEIKTSESTAEVECTLYTQLLCKKLQTLKESTREIAMLEIDRYIYNLKQQEKSNLTLATPTLMEPVVGQYSPKYNLSPNSEYSSTPQHTPEYKPEFPIQFSPGPHNSQSSEEPSQSHDPTLASSFQSTS